MFNPQWHRLFTTQPRFRKILLIALATVTLSFIICSDSSPSFQTGERFHKAQGSEDVNYDGGRQGHHNEEEGDSTEWDVNIEDPRYWSYATDHEDPDYGVPGNVGRPQQEEELRRIWRHAYEMTARQVLILAITSS